MLWPFGDGATKDDRVTHKKPWSLSDGVVPREPTLAGLVTSSMGRAVACAGDREAHGGLRW